MLSAHDLRFSYGRRRKVDVLTDFSWGVAAGKTTLLLGPNGAGKSTLHKLLSGFERPQRGAVTINGRSDRESLYRKVGWMPQEVQPARGLTVAEQVEYVAWLGGASSREARRRSATALEAVDLMDKHDVRADRVSGGQLRRVGLAQALVRNAPVLLLDEPTAGLDPAQALNFLSLLRGLDCPGGIVISTHQVSDLAEDVDRITVLADGVLRFDDDVAAFRQLGAGTEGAGSSLAQVFASMIGGGTH
ncbi:ABC transporter ATP-binding protein [Nocardioides sp.]